MKASVCPICGLPYEVGSNKPRRKSRHHIFCKRFYPSSTVLVEICQKCHDEFHRIFKYNQNKRWSKLECVHYWILFCKIKNVNYKKAYPCLKKY